MGISNYDKESGDRTYSARYALDSAAGVRQLLSEYHALVGRQYQGDYDAVVILADLATAIAGAGLTDRQREALRLIFVEDLTQKAAGERMGVGKQTVNRLINVALTKVARVYEYWARHGEGYSITDLEVDK